MKPETEKNIIIVSGVITSVLIMVVMYFMAYSLHLHDIAEQYCQKHNYSMGFNNGTFYKCCDGMNESNLIENCTYLIKEIVLVDHEPRLNYSIID